MDELEKVLQTTERVKMIYVIPDEDIDDFEELLQELTFFIRRMEPMRKFLLKASKHIENQRPEFEW